MAQPPKPQTRIALRRVELTVALKFAAQPSKTMHMKDGVIELDPRTGIVYARSNQPGAVQLIVPPGTYMVAEVAPMCRKCEAVPVPMADKPCADCVEIDKQMEPVPPPPPEPVVRKSDVVKFIKDPVTGAIREA